MLNGRATIVGYFLLHFAGALGGQDCHIALRGHVTDADTKEALAYASVFVKEIGKGAITDENGWFAIPNLCEKTPYTVEISHIECAHFTQVVRLTENTVMEFRLVHDAILNEVVIHEKALALPNIQAESQVDRLDLEASKGVNLGEALKRLPGVTTLNTGHTIAKPVIQGLHSNRIAIVNNGVALEGQQWGSEHAPEIDPFTADKITVVKGASGVRYGVGAMAGAVVLEPAPLRAAAGVGGWLSLGGFSNGLGGLASGAVDWHLPSQSLTFRLQGTAKRSGNLRAPDYFLGNTGAAELNLSAMAGWKNTRWTHDVGASIFTQQIGILRSAHIGNLTDLQLAIESPVPLNNRDAFAYEVERPYQQVRHYLAKYRTTYRLSEKWKISSQYAFQFNNREEYDVVRSTGSAADKPQLSFRLWTNTLDVALEHFPIGHWQGGIGVQGIQQTNLVGRGGLIPDYRALGGSVWLVERWRRFPDPWEVEFGLRYDYRQTNATTSGSLTNIDTLVHFANVSGTAGLTYHLGKHLSATVHTGYAWRPPHVNELFARGIHHGAATYEEGRPDLRTEKAWNSNVTFQYRNRQTEAALTLYRNQIRDFIYLDPQNTFVLTVRGAFPAYFYAQADAVLRGLDGSLTVPVLKSLFVESRVSLLRGERIVPDSFESNGDKKHDWLPLMPTDRFQYGLRWVIHRKSSVGASRSDDVSTAGATSLRLMATTAVRQSRIPAAGLLKAPPPTFTVLSFDATHTFHLNNGKKKEAKMPLEVGLTVQNLTNTRYREYLNFFRFYADEPGLNMGIRAKLLFG
ncbi:MAG: TonB-dependent receptor [Saprospiraceae bacterium]|nr:TonB-dependent receptor [Saprospiraceae bacterium]